MPDRFASTPLSINRELERAIAEAPYDEDRWIVLEDWLLECDDPRSVIVRLEKVNRMRGARRLLRHLHPQLLGEDHATLAPALFIADWRAGYLRECHFAANEVDALGSLCRAPAATLLRRLTVSIPKPRVATAMEQIAGGVFADTLHDLTVSNVHVEAPILSASMLARLPRLRRLALRGAYVEGPAEIERIATLLVAPTRYDLANLTPFLRDVRFAAVTDLLLDLTNLAEPALEPSTLEPVLTDHFTPRLQRIEIRMATPQIARDAIRILATSALLPQLRAVNLGGIDASARMRRDHGDVFDHLNVMLPDGY